MTICHLLGSLQQFAQELLGLDGLPGLSPAVASQLVLGDGLADCSSRGIPQWMGLTTAAAGYPSHKKPDVKADLWRIKKVSLLPLTHFDLVPLIEQ